MQRIIKWHLFLFLFVGLLTGCKDDDKPIPEPKPTPEAEPYEISQFIWEELKTYYLWVDDVPNLNLTQGSEDWEFFLNKYDTEYEDLFYSLLYKYGHDKRTAVDRFSWIVDDYKKLENSFAGISKSFGFEFKLSRYSDGNDVFGYVTYIIPNSPAANSDLKRGDVFVSVNDTKLNTGNYHDLLFNSPSYSLGLANVTIEGDKKTISSNGKSVSLTAVELTENPVHMTKVFPNINGKTVGYLVYNSFTGTSEFNTALIDSIGKLKDAGINELVLDLRYNGGGSIYSATLLGSMIYGKHKGTVFAKTQYNQLVQNYFVKEFGENSLNYNFVKEYRQKADDGQDITIPLNLLDLSDVYIITSDGSASASELVINGLKPYMHVTQVGDTTYGKNVGSITLYDYIDDKGTKNPDHTWAMQPIVLKIANANDFSDYTAGLFPNYIRNEWNYLENIKPLGDPEEALLKVALDLISNKDVSVSDPAAPTKKLRRYSINGKSHYGEIQGLGSSKDRKPLANSMYDDRIIPNLSKLKKDNKE